MGRKHREGTFGQSIQGKCLYVIGVSAHQESESALKKVLPTMRRHAPERAEAIEKSHRAGKDFIVRRLENVKPGLILIDRGFDYFPESRMGNPRGKEARRQENLFAVRWAKENNIPVKLLGLAEMFKGPEDKLNALRAEKIAAQARDRFLALPAGNICLFVEKGLLDGVCNHLSDIHPVKRASP